MNVTGYTCDSEKSDNELMQELVKGNTGAMEAIYHRHEASLRAVILSVLHEDADVDDVLHDVFLQLWKNADRFMPEKGLHGFLVTLARRRALDRVRRKLAYRRATDRFESYLKTEVSNRVRSTFRHFTNIDLADLMTSLIRQLPEAQQEVVNLTFYQGLSQREIASRKRLALGTVKTRLQLAQKKLLNQLAAVQEARV